MATVKVKRIIFTFDGDHPLGSAMETHSHKIQCHFCEEWFKSPHIQTSIDGFTICPACINAGVVSLAAESKRIAGDLERVARMWSYNLENKYSRIDAKDMAGAYRRLASGLRGLCSFEDLPGGKVALGVAAVLQAPAERRKRKAA